MGCDIHSIGQVKKNGKWETVTTDVGGGNRNYNTFAVLADVRNGRGFAGRKSGEGWPVIAEPRGLPNDLELENSTPDSYGYVEAYVTLDNGESMWLGDHSYSHLTLEEIEVFIETRFPKKYETTGVVGKKTFLALESGELESPDGWCGGIGGKDVICVTAEEARKEGAKYTHVQTSWENNAMDSNGIDGYVEDMRELAKEYDVNSDEIRIVFGFDS